MLGDPTTIISPSKHISHEKSMDIQIQDQRTRRSQISQPWIEIRSQRLFSSPRSTLLRELRSSSFLQHDTSTFCTHKYFQFQSAAIRRVCRFDSKQTRFEPSTCLLWIRWRIRRSTQICLSSSPSSIRHERQSLRMGSAPRKRLHRFWSNTPQKRRICLRKICQQLKESNPKHATKPGQYYRSYCLRSREW